jgi:ketosteroid isomerase-like protein
LEIYEKVVNEGDLDTIIEIEEDAIGYGCRTPAPRLLFNKKLNKWFSDSMEFYEAIPKDDYIVRVVGDVGLVLGSFTEKFKPKGGALQKIEVRNSMTFIRVDGKWKLALYHRDTQFAK